MEAVWAGEAPLPPAWWHTGRMTTARALMSQPLCPYLACLWHFSHTADKTSFQNVSQLITQLRTLQWFPFTLGKCENTPGSFLRLQDLPSFATSVPFTFIPFSWLLVSALSEASLCETIHFHSAFGGSFLRKEAPTTPSSAYHPASFSYWHLGLTAVTYSTYFSICLLSASSM